MAAWHTFREFDSASVEILVDVGAHEGLYARRAARYFPLKRTVLVEPLESYAERLRLLDLPGMTVIQKALSNSVGKSSFTIGATEQTSSLLQINSEMSLEYGVDMAASKTVPVDTTTLDTLTEELNLKRIDLIKIDVQGAERELLNGAASSLRIVRYLQIEVLFVEHYFGCAQFFEIHNILTEAGFKLCRFADYSWNNQGVLLQADAIYLNQGFNSK